MCLAKKWPEMILKWPNSKVVSFILNRSIGWCEKDTTIKNAKFTISHIVLIATYFHFWTWSMLYPSIRWSCFMFFINWRVYLYIFFQILSSLLLWLLARMVLELAVVLCPMEVVDFFQGVPNEIWFQVVRII